MKLLISPEAAKSVKAVIEFIESQNTSGSGVIPPQNSTI